MILVGNKMDLDEEYEADGEPHLLDTPILPSSMDSSASIPPPRSRGSTTSSRAGVGFGSTQTATVAPEGREVSTDEASRWASAQGIPVTMQVSAFSGENVNEVFSRLARMILTKIELGEINPDDPSSGIQYGDSGGWSPHAADGASIKSGMTVDDGSAARRRRGGRQRNAGWSSGLREWEEVFRLDRRRGRGGCC
jgi:Ras family